MTVDHNETPTQERKKRKKETMGRGPTHHLRTRYDHKDGLYCDGCQCELYRTTIGMAGLQHTYDPASDHTTGEFKLLCIECSRDADGVVRIKDLFPDKLILQIGRITHYLARDTVGLLQFFRVMERITYGLGLQQDLSYGSDSQFQSWSTLSGNERLFLPEDN